MEIRVTEEVAEFLKEEGLENVLTLSMEIKQNNVACGGKQIYCIPEIKPGKPALDDDRDYNLIETGGFKVYVDPDIEAFPNKPIVIDIEELVFVKSLIVNGVRIPMVSDYAKKKGIILPENPNEGEIKKDPCK